ncbi:unnamed protein product [Closterium sp. NIES-53]
MLPYGTIRLITPHLAAATEDLLPPPPPPAADYQPRSTEGGKRARGRSDGLRLSPPPTPRAGTRYADSEDARAHTDWAQTYPRCASLQPLRTPGILTAADVLREFPRHYLALSPAAPPPGSPHSRGVSADSFPDEHSPQHIPLPAWRPLIPGATYRVVPHTLRQAGQGSSSRSLLRTFASCPERFDSATDGDGNGREGVFVARNTAVSRTALSTYDNTALERYPTSSGYYGDTTYPPSCTRYNLHYDNPPHNWSQGNKISRAVSYSGPHATDETPLSYTACDSLSRLQGGGTPLPAGVGVNNGVGSHATGDVPSPLLLTSSSLTFPPSTSTGSGSRRLLRKVKLSALCKWFYGSSCSGNDCCNAREKNVIEWGEGSNFLKFTCESALNEYSCSCCRNIITSSNTANTISRSSTGSSINTNTPRSTTVSNTAPRGHLGNAERHKRKNTHPQPGCCSGIMRSSSLVTEEPFSRIELCSTADACIEDMRRAAKMLELALKRTEDYEV